MYKQFHKLVLASTAVLAMVPMTGAIAGDASQDVTEARQETQIWTTYALSPYLRASDLKVSVNQGKATLTGTVDEDVNKDLAKQIALGVDGIKEVDNQIVVKSDYTPPARSGRTFGETIDDATLTAKVKSKLMWSKHADGLATDVDTRAGRVTLTGTADSGAAKELAGKLAENTRGVVSVDNQLTVVSPKPTMADKTKKSAHKAEHAVADTWITTKVKSTYMYSRNVDSSDISVTTEKGVVTLSGKVDSGAERELAIELAKNVRGVKRVHAVDLKTSGM